MRPTQRHWSPLALQAYVRESFWCTRFLIRHACMKSHACLAHLGQASAYILAACDMCEWQNGSCCGEDSQECTQCSIRCILRQEIQPEENAHARVSMSTDEGHGTTPSPRLKPFATPPASGGQLAAVPDPSPGSAPGSSPRQAEAPARTTPSPPTSPSRPRDKRQRTQEDLEAGKPAGDPDAAGQKRSNPSSRAASPWLASSDGGGAPDPPASNGLATFKAPHFSVRRLSIPSPLPPAAPSDPSAPVKICAVCDGPGKHEDPRYDAWHATPVQSCSIRLFYLP